MLQIDPLKFSHFILVCECSDGGWGGGGGKGEELINATQTLISFSMCLHSFIT